MGQYTRRGPIGALEKMCPILKGEITVYCIMLISVKNTYCISYTGKVRTQSTAYNLEFVLMVHSSTLPVAKKCILFLSPLRLLQSKYE